MSSKNIDVNNAIAVSRDIYWVGYIDNKTDLHCNPYLLIDEDDIILFDPGSIPDFPIIMRKIIDLINPEEITAVVIHHQDPDVCGNLAVVEDIIGSNNLIMATHSYNARFINHLGIRGNCYEVDKHDYQLTLKSGRVIKFIHTPYLHSPFGIVSYDTKSKALFSSDIFGAISNEWNLFAEGDYLNSISTWHQLISPSSRILNRFLKSIESLDIKIILPQHGSILEEDQIKKVIDHLKTLPCGIDLMEDSS